MLQKKNFYINGKWIVPKNQKDIQVIDPATERSSAVISLGGKEDVDAAVIAAKDAFVNWGFTSKEERIKLLEKLYEIYKKRWNDISDAITLEMGAPKDFSTKMQASAGASHIKSFINLTSSEIYSSRTYYSKERFDDVYKLVQVLRVIERRL